MSGQGVPKAAQIPDGRRFSGTVRVYGAGGGAGLRTVYGSRGAGPPRTVYGGVGAGGGAGAARVVRAVGLVGVPAVGRRPAGGRGTAAGGPPDGHATARRPVSGGRGRRIPRNLAQWKRGAN